jgi:hypothetical protein
MPSDGDEYEGEFDDDEGSVGARPDGRLSGDTEAATDVEAKAQADSGEEAAAVTADLHHPV